MSASPAASSFYSLSHPAHDGTQYAYLPANTNQALGLAHFSIDFLAGKVGAPAEEVLRRVEAFHTDSVVCGLSALALGTNAPTVLRAEALDYEVASSAKLPVAKVFGSNKRVSAEKAVAANVSAVREWDSNGTVFGYNSRLGKKHMAGEFGHNDFYPAIVAACQFKGLDGATAIRAMLLVDEIRGRLAEVFSLKTYHIDHVVHGAIASACCYGALLGATPAQIESAIGMVVAHYIPFRAIRAGEQLSDSKGASAAISTEVALMSVHRSMRGFVGPADIFRNPEAIFRKFQPTTPKMTALGDSPFEIVLTHSGKDFAVMGMHFKLGLYEHQSAGALQAMLDLFRARPQVLSAATPEAEPIENIKIVAYQPAFGIIGDPSKRNPTTRQSADHSMVYIIATLLRKARAYYACTGKTPASNVEAWSELMLLPIDYSRSSVQDKETRRLMDLISFEHGGDEYDSKYPEGIPTSVVVTEKGGEKTDSKMVLFPSGHARFQGPPEEIQAILNHKFKTLASLAVKDPSVVLSKLSNLSTKSAKELDALYEFDIEFKHGPNAPGKGQKRAREDSAEEQLEATQMEY